MPDSNCCTQIVTDEHQILPGGHEKPFFSFFFNFEVSVGAP